MAKSKTRVALDLVGTGITPYEAAKRAGIAPSSVYRAIGRQRDKDVCPCCKQIVREGFDIDDYDEMVKKLHTKVADARMAEAVTKANYSTAMEILRPFASLLKGELIDADDKSIAFKINGAVVTIRNIRDAASLCGME